MFSVFLSMYQTVVFFTPNIVAISWMDFILFLQLTNVLFHLHGELLFTQNALKWYVVQELRALTCTFTKCSNTFFV